MVIAALCIYGCFPAVGQSEYEVGISRVSTEPDSTLFSVALSGYGYPPEGRFSIEWIRAGKTPLPLRTVTGAGDLLYGVDSAGGCWRAAFGGGTGHWARDGKAPGVVALASWKDDLYAVTDAGVLLRRKRSGGRWSKIGEASGMTALAALKGKLYGADRTGILRSLDLSHIRAGWTAVGRSAGSVASLAAYGERLFAAGAADTLWHIEPLKPGAPWTEMGRYNGVTYDIHVAALAVAGHKLYAVSRGGGFFVSRQASDGDLSATAIAVRRGAKTVVMMGVDLTGFDYSLTDAVKDIVSRERHIPKEAILINASHTHFPPTAQAYPAWAPFLQHPDTLYLRHLKQGMVDAAEHALDSLAPADLYFGRGETRIGINRSAADPGLPIDRTLDILVAKSPGGAIKAVLFLTACHAVFNNAGREGFTLSANFPGVTRKLILEKTGAPSVFIQGCAGDINPASSDHVATGTELANDIFRMMNGPMTKLSGGIDFAFDSMRIPVRPWSPEKIRAFRKENEGKPGDVEAVKNVRWSDLMLRRYATGKVQNYLPEYFQYLSIGSWAIVGLSREVVDEYGPAIRQLWPDKAVSVAGYCNDVSSYLPREWHVVTQTYEGYGSFFWYGQPGLPPVNVFDQVMNGVRKFKDKQLP